ncbi:MAG: hypothetical protein LAQ69_43910 [Acidobacteriia bacterium]|nr:hypothetical protein [Terriglobia bacterium]
MPRRRTRGWMAVALICLAAAAHAQYVQQGSKLVASSAMGASDQGTSVAVSADGNTAIVGGPNDNSGAGAVWVFTRNNGTWVQQGGKLMGNGVDKGIAGQGSSVALSADGNTAIIGGSNDNDGTGAMWAFTRANGVWTQQGPKQIGTLTAKVGISHQGISVAVSADGNTALVGGDLDNNFLGAAWVFTRTGGVWALNPVQLVGNATVQAHVGTSVALSADGNTAILGGPGDSAGVGAAFVFARANGAWTQQGGKLIGAGATANAGFGTSVALSADGNTALVGGSGDNNTIGAVWVFTRVNGQWSQQGVKLVGSDPAVSRYLGQSAALSGDGNTALVGGPGSLITLFGRRTAVGATWVFTRSNGVWSQQGGELAGSGTTTNDALQGTSVAVTADGTTALVGGPADNGSVGAAWVFTRPPAPSPPAITTQPANQTISRGQTATLNVAASGAAPLFYQWYQGTAGITSTPVGTNSTSYTTPALTATAAYWVRVSNPFGSVDSNTATVTVGAGGPVITQVLNAASQSPIIAPNTWVAIYGANLSPAGETRSWQNSDFVNNLMPVQLDFVTATVNGRSAYVSYISPTQLNVLTPPDAMQGLVEVQTTSGGVASAQFAVQAQAISPAFFAFSGGPYVAAEHADGSYLGPAGLVPGEITTPARPGEVVALFGSGFGPTSTAVVSGSLVQSGTLPTLPVVVIGGITATVQFAGLVFPGEFQFNVVVPPAAPDGDNAVTAVYNGLSTQTGLLLTVAR